MILLNSLPFKNYFYFNYFILKNYEHIFYFLFYLYKFNFISPQLNKFLIIKNDYFIENNKNCTNVSPIFYKKFNTYFNSFYKRVDKKNYYSSYIHTNKDIYNFNKNFINFFYSLTFNKNKFIILDTDYSYIYPLYKFIYGINTLQLQKYFFFIKPIYFTRKSWSYLFLKFCYKNNVSLIFIADFNYFVSFYKNIIEFDCSVSAIVPYTYVDYFIDYPLYTIYTNNIIKLVYISSLSQIFFQSYNIFNFYKKQIHLNFFKKVLDNMGRFVI